MQFQEVKIMLKPLKFESNNAIDESKADGIDDSSVLKMPHRRHREHRKVKIFS